MKKIDIFTMASGNLPDDSGFKFFFFAQDVDGEADLLSGEGSNGAFYLIQLIISNSGDVNVVIKTSSPDITSARSFLPNHLFGALSSLSAATRS